MKKGGVHWRVFISPLLELGFKAAQGDFYSVLNNLMCQHTHTHTHESGTDSSWKKAALYGDESNDELLS